MFASVEDRTVTMSRSMSRAFAGIDSGYIVHLHDLPAYTFRVDAPTMDEAIAAAFECARREGRARSNAATVQRIA